MGPILSTRDGKTIIIIVTNGNTNNLRAETHIFPGNSSTAYEY